MAANEVQCIICQKMVSKRQTLAYRDENTIPFRMGRACREHPEVLAYTEREEEKKRLQAKQAITQHDHRIHRSQPSDTGLERKLREMTVTALRDVDPLLLAIMMYRAEIQKRREAKLNNARSNEGTQHVDTHQIENSEVASEVHPTSV